VQVGHGEQEEQEKEEWRRWISAGSQSEPPFDLGCSSSKLRFWKLDDLTVGVKRCGKRGTYVQTCRDKALDRECTWILNGVIESTKRKPEPKSGPEPEPESSSPGGL
jgi:hypothetical protein